jgi:hypothetical protein
MFIVVIISISSLCKRKPEENYLEPVNVSNNPGRSENPSIAVDSNNTVHLVWHDDAPGNEEIFYSYKPESGNWSNPVNISNNAQSSRYPCITIDKTNVIHVAWQDYGPSGHWSIYYIQKLENSEWSMPETITGDDIYVDPKIIADDSSNIHLIWLYGGYHHGIRYAKRTKQNTWTSQSVIVDPTTLWYPKLTVDKNRNVHVIWGATLDFLNWNIFYSTKTELGEWAPPINISNTGKANSINSIVSDNRGDIHCIWHDDSLNYLNQCNFFYRMKKMDDTWVIKSPPCTLNTVWLNILLATGPGGELYIPGSANHNDSDKYYLLYITKPYNGIWSDTIICGTIILDPQGVVLIGGAFICDNNGKLYFIGEKNNDIYCIEYKR